MQPAQYWKIRPELVIETEAHYRDKIVSSLTSKNSLEKVKVVTFDGVAPNITVDSVMDLLYFVNTKLLPGVFRGVGLEVGAGCGFFSALVARFPGVSEIYAVEISKPIVDNLLPEIVTNFAMGNEKKVVPCVGDFSFMEIPDRSIDFVFDFFSLHHSDDLNQTFREINRVLKPGGFLICLDKARADYLTPDDLDKLLDTEYSTEFKKFMGADPNIKWTRRMNGEREFRLKDWVGYGEQADLKLHSFAHLARTVSGNPIFRISKTIISKLPIFIQKILARVIGVSGKKHANQLETKEVIFLPLLKLFPKEISFFSFIKK